MANSMKQCLTCEVNTQEKIWVVIKMLIILHYTTRPPSLCGAPQHDAAVCMSLSVGARQVKYHLHGKAGIWQTEWSKCAASSMPDEQHSDKAASRMMGYLLHAGRATQWQGWQPSKWNLLSHRHLLMPLFWCKPGMFPAMTVASKNLFLVCKMTVWESWRGVVALGWWCLGRSTMLPTLW